MKSFKQGILHGFGIFISLIALVGMTTLIAQTINSFSSGNVVSASRLNENFNSIQTIIAQRHQVAAPEGAIMAFYLAACPSGWLPADGTNSTPDLRGVFIRGLNSFDSGTTSNARDPDGGSRTIGTYQADEFASHNHGIRVFSGNGGALDSVYVGGYNFSSNSVVESRGGNETRPRNVALIYCMRKDS